MRITEDMIQSDQIEENLLTNHCDNISSTHDSSKQWHFEVLSLPRLQTGRLTLSIPKQAFQRIQDSWNLHPRTVEVFLSNNGLFTTFHCTSTGRVFFILKVANSRITGSDAVSVTYDPSRRTTFVLYHHLQNQDSVFSTLLSTPERCVDPCFFIAALYRSHHQHIEEHRSTIDDAILSIERQTGYGKSGRLVDPGRRPSLDQGRIFEDSKTLIQQLSFCQTDLAVIRHAARCCLDCGEWLIQAMDERIRSSEREPPLQDAIPASLRTVQSMVREDVVYTRRRIVMLLSQVQSITDRSQSQSAYVG